MPRLHCAKTIFSVSPQVQVRIEGHADERGSTEYNMALGNRRAEAIRQFLQDSVGREQAPDRPR